MPCSEIQNRIELLGKSLKFDLSSQCVNYINDKKEKFKKKYS